MVSSARISILDARFEVAQHLTADERAELAGVTLPVVSVDAGRLDLQELMTRHRAFGATVLDGVVMSSLQIGAHRGLQLLGPGDLLVTGNEFWPAWLAKLELRPAAPAALGLLSDDLLAAAYRWPRLIEGLYGSIGYQLRRLTAQMVICQLPRVEDRVRAMLWLLAESWGHVTPDGVRLPLALTHETLGALVGARRPTVTLAVRKLTDDGSLVAQDSGWLLHDSPPPPAGHLPSLVPGQFAATSVGRWAAPPPAPAPVDDQSELGYAELRETVRRLREQHRDDRRHTEEQLARTRVERVRMVAARKRIAEDALRRRSPPSS
jgi:CRP/FNR family transcriptional regulator, cyclic AMP receptor protein